MSYLNFGSPLDIATNQVITYENIVMLKHMYNDPRRKYHNEEHLSKLWALFTRDVNSHTAAWKYDMMSAIIWHDAIYDPHLKNNEKLSAELYRIRTPSDYYRQRVYDAIVASADHWQDTTEFSDSYFVEEFLYLDIFELGSPWITFNKNTEMILAELEAFMPDTSISELINGRRKWLEGLLEKDEIFPYSTVKSKGIRPSEEERARENISNEIDILDVKLRDINRGDF